MAKVKLNQATRCLLRSFGQICYLFSSIDLHLVCEQALCLFAWGKNSDERERKEGDSNLQIQNYKIEVQLKPKLHQLWRIAL